ncbi:MAG: hypothetical protein MUF00_10125 [Gemmatimonadaceae bacterium]|jgi:hypothetical protein|nr:hypothetical protein [Gemmatimonadaceae bacterium]
MEHATHEHDEATPPALNEVRALVQERERFDAWLTALEAKREQTPEKVYARVHGDYRARRDAVLGSLAAHVAPLRAWSRSLAVRQEALGDARAGHEEERAEASLRHDVGEFSDAQWDEVRTRVDAALEGLESEESIIRAERDDVERLLASAEAGVPVASPEPEPAVEAPSSAVASPEGAPEVSGVAAPEGDSADEAIVSIDEVTVVDVRVATPTPVSIHDLFGVGASAPESAHPTPTAPLNTHDDEIEAAWQESAARGFDPPSGAVPRVTQEVAALERFEVYTGPNPTVADATPPAPMPAESAAPLSESEMSSTANAFDDLAFLRSLTVTPEQTKTLRCTECNTMNFPTEWYCERCGGELAAL